MTKGVMSGEIVGRFNLVLLYKLPSRIVLASKQTRRSTS